MTKRQYRSNPVASGTDSPLASQTTDSEYIMCLSLSDSQKEGILGENARELIGLSASRRGLV